MRMMPGGGGRWRHESCPLCASLYPPSLTERLCARLRPLVTEFTRLNLLLPKRRSSRCGLALCVSTVIFFIALTYISPARLCAGGWLYAFGAGRGPAGSEACPLLCPHTATGDSRWQPIAIPARHGCNQNADLPVPCPANKTTSELLQMPPIHFLPNFRTPCWYEALPQDADPNYNPYSHNLYMCFSEGARKDAIHMTSVWLARSRTERDPKRLRCLPYFYIAGMPKSGSTDLFRKLTLHPDVVRPPMKEPHFWSRNRFGMKLNYSSLIPLRDYMDLFDKAALQIEERSTHSDNDHNFMEEEQDTTQDAASLYHHVITGDASASTFWGNDDWWRLPENCGRKEPLFTNAHYILRLTPNARIVVIIRNPTERLYSDYLYFQKTNKSVALFHEEVLVSIKKFEACLGQNTLRACLYDKHVSNGVKVRLRIGVYHVYLEEWLKVFPPEQVLVLRTEDYAAHLKHTIRRVYHFLGLRELSEEEEARVVESPIANTRKLKDKNLGPMWEETRRVLQSFYQPYNQRLAQLLEDQRYLWDDLTVATQQGPADRAAQFAIKDAGPASVDGVKTQRDSSDNMAASSEHVTGQQSGATGDVIAVRHPVVDDGGGDRGDHGGAGSQGDKDEGEDVTVSATSIESIYEEEYGEKVYAYNDGDSGYKEYADGEEDDKER